MSMRPQEISPVPEETARVARAANPKGNVYMSMRDELGSIYQDQIFVALFAQQVGEGNPFRGKSIVRHASAPSVV